MGRQIAWKARLIHPAAATSLSLAKISLAAELLFWRMIPQADDQGRLPGDPKILKAITCPIREEIPLENIPVLLKELEEEKLIICYAPNDETVQIAKWWDYQCPQWAYPSKHAPPVRWEDHCRYRIGGKVITINWPPGQGTGEVAAPTPLSDYLAKIAAKYQQEIGLISASIDAELKDFVQHCEDKKVPVEWIDEAFKEAAANNKRSWSYVKAILTNWIDHGKGSGKKGKVISRELPKVYTESPDYDD